MEERLFHTVNHSRYANFSVQTPLRGLDLCDVPFRFKKSNGFQDEFFGNGRGVFTRCEPLDQKVRQPPLSSFSPFFLISMLASKDQLFLFYFIRKRKGKKNNAFMHHSFLDFFFF